MGEKERDCESRSQVRVHGAAWGPLGAGDFWGSPQYRGQLGFSLDFFFREVRGFVSNNSRHNSALYLVGFF